MRIRTKTINQDFNESFDRLASIFGCSEIGSKVMVWLDKIPRFTGAARERQKQWANMMQAVVTCCVLAERGSVEMTRQQDYQGRSLGFFLDEKFVERTAEAERKQQ